MPWGDLWAEPQRVQGTLLPRPFLRRLLVLVLVQVQVVGKE